MATLLGQRVKFIPLSVDEDSNRITRSISLDALDLSVDSDLPSSLHSRVLDLDFFGQDGATALKNTLNLDGCPFFQSSFDFSIRPDHDGDSPAQDGEGRLTASFDDAPRINSPFYLNGACPGFVFVLLFIFFKRGVCISTSGIVIVVVGIAVNITIVGVVVRGAISVTIVGVVVRGAVSVTIVGVVVRGAISIAVVSVGVRRAIGTCCSSSRRFHFDFRRDEVAVLK